MPCSLHVRLSRRAVVLGTQGDVATRERDRREFEFGESRAAIPDAVCLLVLMVPPGREVWGTVGTLFSWSRREAPGRLPWGETRVNRWLAGSRKVGSPALGRRGSSGVD